LDAGNARRELVEGGDSFVWGDAGRLSVVESFLGVGPEGGASHAGFMDGVVAASTDEEVNARHEAEEGPCARRVEGAVELGLEGGEGDGHVFYGCKVSGEFCGVAGFLRGACAKDEDKRAVVVRGKA